MKLLCKVFGHRLETASHAKEATLWCKRCKSIVWFLHEPSGLILHADMTNEDFFHLGVRLKPLEYERGLDGFCKWCGETLGHHKHTTAECRVPSAGGEHGT